MNQKFYARGDAVPKGDKEVTVMELKEAIDKCLLENESLCMNVASERAKLSKAIMEAIKEATVSNIVKLSRGWIDEVEIFASDNDAKEHIRKCLKEDGIETGSSYKDVEDALYEYNQNDKGIEIQWFLAKSIQV